MSKQRWTNTSSTGELGLLRPDGDGVTVAIWAQPGAARAGVVGVDRGVLRVRVHAPAREGRANEELRRLLADFFSVAPADVCVLRGARARQKRVRVRGVTIAQAEAAIHGAEGG